MYALGVISVRKCGLRSVGTLDRRLSDSLFVLSLIANRLETFTLTYPLRSLTHLDLSSNVLTSLDSMTFSYLPNLVVCRLGDNALGQSLVNDVEHRQQHDD